MASEINVAPTGTVKSATRYQRTGTRHRTLRRARSTTPSRPASAPVTTKALTPTPSTPPKTPCSGRSNGKASALTIRNRHSQEIGAQTNRHERQHRMTCDDAEQCRHQSIVLSRNMASEKGPMRRVPMLPRHSGPSSQNVGHGAEFPFVTYCA
jgi:hypothetical protein